MAGELEYNDELPAEPVTVTNTATGEVFVIDASNWPETDKWWKHPPPTSAHWTAGQETE